MNLNFTRQLYTAVAKSSRENDSMWLPVWMHSIDAAGIIKLLLDNWLPENVVLLLEKECGGRERLVSVLLFCALNHDLGKLTCLFQVKISTVMSDSMFTELIKLPCLSCFYDADKSPHAVAGEVILHSFGCPDEIASIIGSHHGKPTDDDIEYQLDKRDGFTQNYYGSLSEKTFWRSMWDEWIDFSLRYADLKVLTSFREFHSLRRSLFADCLSWLTGLQAIHRIFRLYLAMSAEVLMCIPTGWRAHGKNYLFQNHGIQTHISEWITTALRLGSDLPQTPSSLKFLTSRAMPTSREYIFLKLLWE